MVRMWSADSESFCKRIDRCIVRLTRPQAAAFAEQFPAAVRYSGASLSLTIGTVFGGAIAPFVATLLYSTTANSWPVTGYAVAVSLISWLCALAVKDRNAH
jgi:hypothetical protein